MFQYSYLILEMLPTSRHPSVHSQVPITISQRLVVELLYFRLIKLEEGRLRSELAADHFLGVSWTKVPGTTLGSSTRQKITLRNVIYSAPPISGLRPSFRHF